MGTFYFDHNPADILKKNCDTTKGKQKLYPTTTLAKIEYKNKKQKRASLHFDQTTTHTWPDNDHIIGSKVSQPKQIIPLMWGLFAYQKLFLQKLS